MRYRLRVAERLPYPVYQAGTHQWILHNWVSMDCFPITVSPESPARLTLCPLPLYL